MARFGNKRKDGLIVALSMTNLPYNYGVTKEQFTSYEVVLQLRTT
jgi:hypothetical protein